MKPEQVGYMDNKKSKTKILLFCVGIALVLALACIILIPDVRVAVLRTIFPGACSSEERMTIPNLSGIEFKTIFTFCDIYEVTVYARRAAIRRESFLSRWLNRRTLLFTYDAEEPDDPPPSIEVSGNEILISVPRVSQVYFQRRKWHSMAIKYDIRQIDNP
jgi:hypothetical protein